MSPVTLTRLYIHEFLTLTYCHIPQYVQISSDAGHHLWQTTSKGCNLHQAEQVSQADYGLFGWGPEPAPASRAHSPMLCTVLLEQLIHTAQQVGRAAGGFMLQPDPAMNASQALPSPLITNRALCPYRTTTTLPAPFPGQKSPHHSFAILSSRPNSWNIKESHINILSTLWLSPAKALS